MFKALIVDDNKMARMLLNGMLSQIKEIKIVGEFEDAPSAISELKKNNIDIFITLIGISFIKIKLDIIDYKFNYNFILFVGANESEFRDFVL